MARLTLGTAKRTIAKVLGVSTSDSRVVDAINEAVERLMTRGDWVGTKIRYRIHTNHAKLTWPRQIETILKCSVCSQPALMTSPWYEFSSNGPGILYDDDCPGLVMEDMGEAPTFDDIIGTDKTIRTLSSHPETTGERILLQGYDHNNLWVRTYDATTAAYAEGEYMLIGNTPHYSTTLFTNLTGVIKPETVGTVFLHEYEASTGSIKALAMYEHDETHPSYRRSRIPGLANHGSCGNDNTAVEGQTTVNVIAKLKFIPVAQDNDYIIIGNLPAIKDMVMSIEKAEMHLVEEAEYFENRAMRDLGKELINHEGVGVPQYDIQEPATFGAGALEGVI